MGHFSAPTAFNNHNWSLKYLILLSIPISSNFISDVYSPNWRHHEYVDMRNRQSKLVLAPGLGTLIEGVSPLPLSSHSTYLLREGSDRGRWWLLGLRPQY
ncbi:hypothetical protein AVEN_243739-1 [Araneus ventricosus]|uniref:Uncharacterized protein n=1 Tax=Araneus ventricosus TaxID=182803 RepID=A0A4Y2A5S9_ARAVE|nr:hypothetical protein AVEN_243739-1 [Araneus ventricosus]